MYGSKSVYIVRMLHLVQSIYYASSLIVDCIFAAAMYEAKNTQWLESDLFSWC